MQTTPAVRGDQVPDDRSRIETFAAISATLNLSQPLEATLSVIAEQVARRLDHAFCAIALHDPSSGHFSIAGSYGLTESYIEAANHQLRTTIEKNGLADAESVTVRAFTTRQPFWVHATSSDPVFTDWKALAKLAGYTSVVFMPLVFRNEAIGVLSCYGTNRAYGRDDVDILQPIADQTATAVGLARLLGEQEGSIAALESQKGALDRANKDLVRSAESVRAATSLLLRDCTLAELVTDLSERIGAEVSVYDTSSQLIGSSHPGTTGDHIGPPSDEALVPVRGMSETHGYIHIERSSPSDQLPDPLLDQVVMACTLYFMRERAAQERELRLTSTLVRDLITSTDTVDIQQIARRLGIDALDGCRLLVVENAHNDKGLTERASVAAALGRLPELAPRTTILVQAQVESAVVAVVSDHTEARDLGTAVVQLLQQAGLKRVRVGLSRSARQPVDLRMRLQELRNCFTLSEASPAPPALTLAEDWYLLTLVMRSADAEDVRQHAHGIFDGIVTSNTADDLLSTLRTLLELRMSIARSAERMFVHTNTIKYRVRNIERLTGCDLHDVGDLMELRVALVIFDQNPDRFRAEARARAAA